VLLLTGSLPPYLPPLPSGSSFFKALDTQLRVHHMRLADFVAAFELSDQAASSGLDEYEFRELVMRVMPEATEGQVGGQPLITQASWGRGSARFRTERMRQGHVSLVHLFNQASSSGSGHIK
jgi:hypothetical protein